MSAARTFKFLTLATVIVEVQAVDEDAARAAFAVACGEEIRLDATTRAGHRVADLHLLDDSPELFQVQGEDPLTECGETGCDGFLVAGQCTGTSRDADSGPDMPGQRGQAF